MVTAYSISNDICGLLLFSIWTNLITFKSPIKFQFNICNQILKILAVLSCNLLVNYWYDMHGRLIWEVLNHETNMAELHKVISSLYFYGRLAAVNIILATSQSILKWMHSASLSKYNQSTQPLILLHCFVFFFCVCVFLCCSLSASCSSDTQLCCTFNMYLLQSISWVQRLLAGHGFLCCSSFSSVTFSQFIMLLFFSREFDFAL